MLPNHNQITPILNFPQQIKNKEFKIEDTKLNSFISTDSTNEPNIHIKRNKYIIENEKKSYNLSIILFEEKIKININLMKEEADYYYEIDFSHEELKKINKVFKLCNDIEESFDYLNDLFKEKQNQLIIYENNDLFKIEKKIQLSLPLKIEIPKVYKNNINLSKHEINNKSNIDNNIFNKDINKLSALNNNDEINMKLEELENENKNMMEKFKKKYLENEENYHKLSKNMSIIDNFVNFMNEKKNEENKKQICSLLSKKRGSISNLSDISFNSNDNEFYNKKNKNNLEKENFLKIFSDNNSVNSGDSNEKFFMKILKKKKLEKENHDKFDKNKNNISLENNYSILNKKEEENISYLYGDQDSSDEIKDDIDFFSNNNSPIETVGGPNNNNKNLINKNDSSINLYKNEKNKSQYSLFSKDNIFNRNEINFNKNKNDNIIKQDNKDNYEEIIKNEVRCDSSLNNSNNIFRSGFDRESNSKKNKENQSYKVIKKNSIEFCNCDLFSDFQISKQYSNKLFSIDSKIISSFGDFDFIINYLKTKFNKQIISFIRIYRGTEDGDSAESFHRLCDGNTNIIIFIKTKNGKKFGGYTSIGFSNYNRSIVDDTAFIFSIDKREIYPNIKGKRAIDSFSNLGPTFSGDSIKIYDNFLLKGGITSKIGINYQTNEDYQINDGKQFFSVEDIEVFEFLEMKI